MAKVALISVHFNEAARNLASALHEQHHDVCVITSKDQQIEKTYPFQILTYFRDWSAKEALLLMPSLLKIAPDVFHFVQTADEEKVQLGHWVLAALGKSFPRRANAITSYLAYSHKHQWSHQYFLRFCDLVTVGNRENLMFLRRNQWLSKDTLSEIFPPILDARLLPQSDKSTLDPELQKLIDHISPFVLIPSPEVSEQLLEEILTLPQLKVLILGPRPRKGRPQKRPTNLDTKRISYLESDIFSEKFIDLASQAKCCLIAGLDFGLLELVQLQKVLWQSQCPVICSERQAEQLPGLYLPGQSGVVFQEGKVMKNIIESVSELRWSESNQLSVHGQLKDLAMNELARLYARALQNAAQSLR